MVRGRVCVMLLVSLVVSLGSCIAPQSSYMRCIKGREWKQSVEVRYPNSDTLSLRRLSIAMRYNSKFKADTLAVVVRITAPDGRWFEEPVVLHLSRPYTSASVASVESVLYRVDNRLLQYGDYTFSITPLVAVEGVEAVGVEIE